jgi:DNA-binding transcriptional LysR family regulator
MRVGANLGLALDVWSDLRFQDVKRAASNARANAATATQLGARDTESVVRELSVSCSSTPGARHLPPIIRHFQNHYPDVRLMIREGDPVEEVERGTLDLALIYDMDLARQVVLHTFGE